ncbi:Membrane protein [Acidisarcina polymorpha]|uniref:Membrane protein n=1 Tax=Acidisarcina polymorpha TaxID=2211140 RepID=A0A2Z5G387_9BACT|nr:M23 family metallopeptidase [Acidisarcina polymorpha]AXC13673.1 Membrane protein [Acidisarcina polymorpha]
MKKIVVLAALILAVLLPVLLLLVFSSTPVVRISPAIVAIGQSTALPVQVSDPHGIRSIAAFIEQNGTRYKAADLSQPARHIFWSHSVPAKTWVLTVGTKATPELKDGKAKLIVEVKSNDFRASTTRVERDIVIATQPPSLSVDADQHYLYLGMADLVTFNATGYWTEAGVHVGDQTFRAWPMPSGKPGQFSLFAFAWNMQPGTIPLVFATNPAGNIVTAQMVFQFPQRDQPKYRVRDLPIDDRFMQKVIHELDPNGSGDPVARFVKINSEMRRANNQTLFNLREKTEAKFLWSQPFLQQHNSKVEANFADVRNYIYQGKKIDQQVHLGYDLSITQHVGVEASNDGRVIYAAPLGIYGNCIVVDHGYGLQTIYGHLSEIAVHEGDTVKRGQIMGKSGETGMAGGDHIHFSMQLDGIQIDPKEWWDAHWIRDHIAKRIDLPGFGS